MLGILTTVSLVPILSSINDAELCFFDFGARGGTSLHVERLSSNILELPATLNFFKLPVVSDPLDDEQCGGRRGARSCKSLVEPVGRCMQPLLLDSDGAVMSGHPPF